MSKQPQIACAGCGTLIDHRRLNGRCPPCNLRPCQGCEKPIQPRNKTGYCASCHTRVLNSNPAFTEKRIAGIRRKYQEPEFLELVKRRTRHMALKAALDPELRERRVAWGKWVHANVLMRPDVVAKRDLALKEIGPKMSLAKLPWCPPEYRARYLRLAKSKKMCAAEARTEIERLMLEDRAARHPCFSLVVDYMRRLTSVLRLDSGNYRVGLADLTPGELLKRAEGKGYEYHDPMELAA